MITYSIIQLSQLEGATRFDAEYYQPDYFKILERLKAFPTQKLGDIAFITDGEHGSPIFDESSGIKYFSAQHAKEGFIDDSDAKFISKIIDEKNKRSRLEESDILLSTVGTIGFAGLVEKELLPANIDRHVALIKLKDKTIDPAFLVAFLNSVYGKTQSIREATGNVQLNLFIDKIKDFVVPLKDNQEISTLIKDALQKLKDSKYLYSQAEYLLLEELGLKDFQLDDSLFYSISLSDTNSAHRFDADYFQPKYHILLSKIKEQNIKPLLEIVENVPARFKPKPDENYHYIELSNINSSIGE